MNRIIFLTIISVLLFTNLSAQDSTGKKILDHSVYRSWKRIENVKISNDGNYVIYETVPGRGDGVLSIQNTEDLSKQIIPRGYDANFSANSDFVIFKIKPQEDVIRKLKSEKKKKEQFPKDTLGIILLKNKIIQNSPDEKSFIKFPNLISYKTAQNNTSFAAFLSTEEGKKKGDSLSKSEIEVYDLTIINPITNKKLFNKNISEYTFSKDGKKIGFINHIKNKTDTSRVFIYDIEKDIKEQVYKGAGYISKLTLNETGDKSAFIYTKDTSKVKRYGLFYYSGKDTRLIADTSTNGLKQDWEVSPFTDISFSADGKKLYFETAPKIMSTPKDTLLEEEKFKVDIWNWQDAQLQSQQIHDLESNRKKNYTAVYDTETGTIRQLADEETETIITTGYGNSDYATGISTKKYEISDSWIQPGYKDVFSINLKTGDKKTVAEEVQFTASPSPAGNYIIWYETGDTSFYVCSNKENSSLKLTSNESVRFYDELNDIPNLPDPYGIAGWDIGDKSVLIYDRYDIWKFDPTGKTAPERLTKGREDQTTYRIVKLNDSLHINSENLLMRTFNEETCEEGFALLKDGSINKLISYDAQTTGFIKSKNSDKAIIRRSTYTRFPEIEVTDISFTNFRVMSETNPQQKDYNWGKIEQVKWNDFEGNEIKGLLLTPENLDEGKKYPMIVYYYERYSDRFHTHYIPSPSRSVINFPLYNSNGYIIFIPDIHYKTGYPGMSAYNSIMSGTQYLLEKYSFIDKDNLGLQGQSWGGYQTAFMVTKTDMFKAAMAGAPVSNMTSAYGGIRWESGMNRIFQYERQQSRIGGTLWEKFDLYVENSPLFKADKISTPLLIMANDNDGAVPWQQGIEFFVSLRRLQKPVWMLTYNGDEHNLMRWPNRVDLSIRMKQFFDHYLKGEAMPEWMKKGIPALKKGIETGY